MEHAVKVTDLLAVVPFQHAFGRGVREENVARGTNRDDPFRGVLQHQLVDAAQLSNAALGFDTLGDVLRRPENPRDVPRVIGLAVEPDLERVLLPRSIDDAEIEFRRAALTA